MKVEGIQWKITNTNEPNSRKYLKCFLSHIWTTLTCIHWLQLSFSNARNVFHTTNCGMLMIAAAIHAIISMSRVLRWAFWDEWCLDDITDNNRSIAIQTITFDDAWKCSSAKTFPAKNLIKSVLKTIGVIPDFRVLRKLQHCFGTQ